jgi:hypothetical protein
LGHRIPTQREEAQAARQHAAGTVGGDVVEPRHALHGEQRPALAAALDVREVAAGHHHAATEGVAEPERAVVIHAWTLG